MDSHCQYPNDDGITGLTQAETQVPEMFWYHILALV